MTPAPWYQFLDHTGDIGILARAPTHEGLYSVATRALFDVIADVHQIEPREKVPVRATGAVDREDLVVRFLSELLFLHDARGWLFCDATIRKLTDETVEAEAVGEPFDPDRHVIERQVKAVTYHHLLLSEDRDGWSLRLVLDL
jgi:SHS2 domain-containing protein